MPDPDADLPRYAIRLSQAATTQAVAEYDRLTVRAGLEAAETWREGLRLAWASLATLPLRCPVAPENDPFQTFRPGPPLRVFLYRPGRTRQVWRVLFTAHEATADDPSFVQVHQIRHSAQAPLTDEEAQAFAADA